jgi:hypothetical protein
MKPTYSDQHPELPKERIIKIEFSNPKSPSCDHSSFNEYQITDKKTIYQFIHIMNESELDGPWKGACFNQIKLTLKDSNIVISTNGKVFGYGNSGMFYKFPEVDIIENFRHK